MSKLKGRKLLAGALSLMLLANMAMISYAEQLDPMPIAEAEESDDEQLDEAAIIEEETEEITEEVTAENVAEEIAADETTMEEPAMEMNDPDADESDFIDIPEVDSLGGTYANPRVANGSTTWDCIWLGSYPQAEVISTTSVYSIFKRENRYEGDYIIDNDLYQKLKNAVWVNGKTTINGEKYRRLSSSDAAYTVNLKYYASIPQNYFYWGPETYHYFKYQPIKWRILKVTGSEALILADKALDTQTWCPDKSSSYKCNWEELALRTYLNQTFYNDAFDGQEQSATRWVTLPNEASLLYSTAAGNDTTERVFLLADSDVFSTDKAFSYGFGKSNSQDYTRVSRSTTFAKAMGAYNNLSQDGHTTGACHWLLRTPAGRLISRVTYLGDVGSEGAVYGAIRPAMVINVQSAAVKPAGTVNSNDIPKTASTGSGSTSSGSSSGSTSGGSSTGSTTNKQGFTDVVKGSFYAAAVDWAVAKGVTTGTTPTTFSPEKACTRGQVVAFLWRAYGCPQPSISTSPFTDVKDTSKYYYKAVLWAAENGITTGTSPTTFSPDDTVTRGQFVTFLYRAEHASVSGGGCKFTDVPAGAFYYKPVIWAAQSGVTTGTSPTLFSPTVDCTRAQVVTFIYRALK